MKPKIQDNLFKISHTLKAFSLKLTGNDMDANDLYQDTALRIISNADKYTPDTNFKAWAITIMRNVFINNYRKRIRRIGLLDQVRHTDRLTVGDRVIENHGEMSVGYKELMLMVNTLSEELKTPFWMAYQGFQYEEIAEALNIPLGTVKSRIFFARKKLMALYQSTQLERA